MGMRPVNFCPEILTFSGHEAQILGGGDRAISAYPRAHIFPFDRIQGVFARRAPNGSRGA